eukprot:m.218323 g.218323  ORF g.218323 m.218323 type:complete len:351 (-) comp22251_c0_seq1:105-1157(-)
MQPLAERHHERFLFQMAAAGERTPVLFYCHPSMQPLAERIAQCCESGAAKRARHSQKHAVLKDRAIQWEHFEDGFPNLFIQDVKAMAGRDVIFLASFHTPEVIFQQLAVIYALPRYLAKSLTVLLPYFPTGTMERVDHEGQVATAMTLATMLNSIPLTARGPATLLIYDIHALQERFYFGQQVIPRLESAVPLFLRRMRELPAALQANISIAFPDDGACKRFQNFFTDVPTVVCNKVRDGDKRIVRIKDGDPSGRAVIIVDDLVKTGGTLIQCAKAIKSAGATTVMAYVTHAVFPEDSWKRFQDGLFEKFWVTDSVPTIAEVLKEQQPFEVLSLADSLAEILLDYDLDDL